MAVTILRAELTLSKTIMGNKSPRQNSIHTPSSALTQVDSDKINLRLIIFFARIIPLYIHIYTKYGTEIFNIYITTSSQQIGLERLTPPTQASRCYNGTMFDLRRGYGLLSRALGRRAPEYRGK